MIQDSSSVFAGFLTFKSCLVFKFLDDGLEDGGGV